MLIQSAFRYGLPLALSIGATVVALRADVLNQDGIVTQSIGQPASPSGAMRQSNADSSNSLYSRSCDELWHLRHAILWSAGYCFHESRAVRIFGNVACGYSRMYEVPLTGGDSQLISLLELVEGAKICPIDR